MTISNIGGNGYRQTVAFDTPLPPRGGTAPELHQPLDSIFMQAAQAELSDLSDPSDPTDLDQSLQRYAELAQQSAQTSQRADVVNARNAAIKGVITLLITGGAASATTAAAVVTFGATAPVAAIAWTNVALATADLCCHLINYYNVVHGKAPLPGGGDSLENLVKIVLPGLGIKEKHIQKIASITSLLTRSGLLIASAGLGVASAVNSANALNGALTAAQGLAQAQTLILPIGNLAAALPGVASAGVVAGAAESKKLAGAASENLVADLKAENEKLKAMNANLEVVNKMLDKGFAHF